MSLRSKILFLLAILALAGIYLWPRPNDIVFLLYPLINFSVFFLIALYVAKKEKNTAHVMGYLAAFALLAVLLQSSQGYIPGRQFEAWTAVLNVSGLAVGFLAARFGERLLILVVKATLTLLSWMRSGPSNAHEDHKLLQPSRVEVFLKQLIRMVKVDFEIAVDLSWGGRLFGRFQDGNVMHMLRMGIIEPETTDFLLENLKPGDCFADVGAHIGYYSLLASHKVGEAGSVYAFEPAPDTYAYLSRNLGEHDNVTVENKAAFDYEGELGLTVYEPSHWGMNSFFPPQTDEPISGAVVKVNTVFLDSYFESKGVTPDFIKIDAESSEIHILRGLASTIQKCHPVLLIELGDYAEGEVPESRAVVDHCVGLGYSGFTLRGKELHPLPMLDRYEYCNAIFKFNET